MFVNDLASAVIRCLGVVDAWDIEHQGISHLNCGSNDEVSISELTNIIKSVVEYSGEVIFDTSKPDGTFRKKMDNTRITNLGFEQEYNLRSGIEKTYNWFIKNYKENC